MLADDYRPDLEEAGIGDGRHGFSIPFTETLLPQARHVLHLRPVGSEVELPSFPLVLMRDHAGLDASALRFILSNLIAEVDRAEKAEDVAPVITALVEFLDAALSRYFFHAEEAAARAADLLNPADFAPQLQTLIESLQRNYPPLTLDIEGPPVVSIIIPVFNKFDLTYNCVKSIIEHGAQIPFEIIVVDDCSRDKTLEVLQRLEREGRVRLLRHEVNQGKGAALRTGFRAARGDIVRRCTATRRSALPARSWCTRTAACRNRAASSGGWATAGTGGAARPATTRGSATCAMPTTSPARR